MSTQSAATIRKSLKSIGITARQVSVRSGACSITCTIKDPAVKLATVEEIANPHESIARDERTGGILAGGNTFITVEYADDALAPIADRVLPQLAAIESSDDPALIREVEGLDVWFLDDCYGGSFRAAPKGWAGDEMGNGYVRPKAFHGDRHASRQIAIMLLNAA
jgi:hypothetical protein